MTQITYFSKKFFFMESTGWFLIFFRNVVFHFSESCHSFFGMLSFIFSERCHSFFRNLVFHFFGILSFIFSKCCLSFFGMLSYIWKYWKWQTRQKCNEPYNDVTLAGKWSFSLTKYSTRFQKCVTSQLYNVMYSTYIAYIRCMFCMWTKEMDYHCIENP